MGNKNFLVSIIVPVYKAKQEYFEQCLESLVNQTYQNIEIIIIDDGSPDNCGDICDAYAANYSQIRVIHKKNEGVSVARNVGMEISHGEFLLFVDADDWLDLECVEKVVKELLLRDSDVLFFRQIDVLSNKMIRSNDMYHGSRCIKKSEIKDIQFISFTEQLYKLEFCPLTPWAKLIKKDLVINNNIVFPKGLKRSQDVIFNLYLWEYIQSAYFYDYYGYYYRKHSDSNVHRYHADIADTMIQFLQEGEKFINKFHSNDNEYKKKMGYRAIKQLAFIENSYTFHPDSKLTKKEIISYSKKYLDTPIVKKYIAQSSVRDCDSVKFLFRYFVIKYRLFDIYYLVCKYIKRKKLQKLNS